jgi:O-antigen/teichoic acid export membrane protein
MTAAPRLGRRALSLGAANAFDFAAQFLLPVVLARCLDPAAFGQYRLLWLVVGTVLAMATLSVPASLYYYLPRAAPPEKRLYINQTLAYLAAAGLACAWALSAWNPWLPATLRELAGHEAIVPAFVFLWVVASVLDLLPSAEERFAWQARAIVGLATLRAGALSLAAALTGELAPVLAALLVFVVVKLALLALYIARHHGLGWPLLRRHSFADQLLYAVPLGLAGALYGLRAQADQWVAAALFPLGAFAAFSIAAVLGPPLLTLCRQSVNYAFLPNMSRLQAEGDVRGMLALNSRSNLMVGAVVFPSLAFGFVYAEELVTVVYTAAYLDAAPVMRVCFVGLAALVVETASITMLMRMMGWVLGLNALALAPAAALNWSAALHFGLAGAAAGSVLVILADRAATLWFIARRTGVPLAGLQDWRSLGRLLASALVAAALAWATVERFLPLGTPLARLAAGAAVLAAAYAALNGARLLRGAPWPA